MLILLQYPFEHLSVFSQRKIEGIDKEKGEPELAKLRDQLVT